MTEPEGDALKIALFRYYGLRCEGVPCEEIDALVDAMLAEDAAASEGLAPAVCGRGIAARWNRSGFRRCVGQLGRRCRRGFWVGSSQPRHYVRRNCCDAGFLAFLSAQVRYIPRWVWAAQVAIVLLMVAVASTEYACVFARWGVGVLSMASVLVGVPSLHSSRVYGVAELECSCRRNAASVMVARMIALGCSCSLCVAVMVAATSAVANIGALSVALWACPPYFCSCAGALWMLRRLRPDAAMLLSVAWTVVCSAVLLSVGLLFPHAYSDAALLVWAAAAAVSFAWLAGEAMLVVRRARVGFEMHCLPAM